MNRLFRLLLSTYPATFRSRFGAEMTAVFHEERRATARRGGLGAVAGLWLRTSIDLVVHGLIVRFGQREPPRAVRSAPAAQGDGFMTQLVQDLRDAFRTLRRAPAFMLLAVITLGLGIGANTAVFSVVNAVLLTPLPYQEPRNLVTVWEQGADGLRSNTGYTTFLDWKERVKSFRNLAVLSYWTPSLSGSGEPERLEGLHVTQEFFSTLGVHPMLGRDFLREEDRPGANRVVIVSWGLWKRRFGGDPAAVGKAFQLNGSAYTLIGVLPRSTESLFSMNSSHPAEIWAPLGYDVSLAWACRDCRHLRALARLAPGASQTSAAAELGTVQRALYLQFPKSYEAGGVILRPLDEDILGDYRRPLWVLLGAVALVLAIACANVSSLVLARAQHRQGEMAVRAALGASRLRIARQLLTESAVLHLLGGAVGVALAAAGIHILVSSSPPNIPRLDTVAIDGRVLLVTFAISLFSGILFGLIPARRAGGRDLRRATASRGIAGGHRFNGVLVASDVALALVLVIGAGLLLESLTRLLAVNVGFDTHHLVAADVTLSGDRYDTPKKVLAYYERVLDRVRSLPGVEAAAVTSQVPLGGNFDGYGVLLKDRPTEIAAEIPTAQRYAISTDYLRTLRIPLRHGRAFGAQDSESAQPVALINESFGRRIWPGEEVLGKQIKLGDPDGPWRTVVGVVGDVRHVSLSAEASLAAYVPEAQWSRDTGMVVVVRAADPQALSGTLRRTIWQIDADRPLTRVAPMDDIVDITLARHLLTFRLLSVFAGIAVLLAMVGIYGVLSYAVSERTREIGVRVALGAVPRRIFGLIFRTGARQVVAGLIVGLLLAFATTRLLAGLLFEVQPQDPLTFAALALALAAVAALAAYLPARRAMAVDPIVAIKAD